MSLIYNFKEHGLYFDKEDDGVPKVYISINTLELIFDLTTGTLIGVQGFLPLVRALISKIDLPDVIEKAYRLAKDDLKECKCNEVYEFSDLKPETQKNFENNQPRYTFRLNLDRSWEDIYGGFHPTTRKILNKKWIRIN